VVRFEKLFSYEFQQPTPCNVFGMIAMMKQLVLMAAQLALSAFTTVPPEAGSIKQLQCS